jgi:hypothetical protein
MAQGPRREQLPHSSERPTPRRDKRPAVQTQFGIAAMLTATRKHLSVVHGLSRFAQVSVGRPGPHEAEAVGPEPQVLLNGHVSGASGDRVIIEAARQGVRQAELELGWSGARHYVVTIEGLAVDGIDADAAQLAAQAATKALIQP